MRTCRADAGVNKKTSDVVRDEAALATSPISLSGRRHPFYSCHRRFRTYLSGWRRCHGSAWMSRSTAPPCRTPPTTSSRRAPRCGSPSSAFPPFHAAELRSSSAAPQPLGPRVGCSGAPLGAALAAQLDAGKRGAFENAVSAVYTCMRGPHLWDCGAGGFEAEDRGRSAELASTAPRGPTRPRPRPPSSWRVGRRSGHARAPAGDPAVDELRGRGRHAAPRLHAGRPGGPGPRLASAAAAARAAFRAPPGVRRQGRCHARRLTGPRLAQPARRPGGVLAVAPPLVLGPPACALAPKLHSLLHQAAHIGLSRVTGVHRI